MERRVHHKCLLSLQATKPQRPRNLRRKKPSELDIEITERKLESANEILNSLSDDPSSGSKQ